jgi:hypothetical protein
MTKKNEISVTIYHVTRGPVSGLGNPSYNFHTDRGVFRTQANLGAAYALENTFQVGAYALDIPATLTTTAAGRVTSWTVAGGE